MYRITTHGRARIDLGGEQRDIPAWMVTWMLYRNKRPQDARAFVRHGQETRATPDLTQSYREAATALIKEPETAITRAIELRWVEKV